MQNITKLKVKQSRNAAKDKADKKVEQTIEPVETDRSEKGK